MMTNELKKRFITASILLTIVLNCLFINKYTWLFLLIIVSILCWLEFFNLTKKIKKKLFSKNILNTISIIFLLLFINSAYWINEYYGNEIVLFLLLVCIFSDRGGYVVGKSIGGKKLTKISPNKTISGSIGSILFSLFPLGIFDILYKVTDIEYYNLSNESYLLFTCITLSIICQIGDLVISYFKRLAKAKDTGKILPGHGGILDRIDGIIFAIISIYYLDIFTGRNFWII